MAFYTYVAGTDCHFSDPSSTETDPYGSLTSHSEEPDLVKRSTATLNMLAGLQGSH
jgi:hypothetical protein